MKTVEISLNSIDKVKSFVNDITRFDAEFDLVSGRYVIDAKSIMGIFSLDISKPITLNIHTENDEKLIDDALNQYYWHIKYLQDPATGLFYHGYNNITKDHMSGFFWGRANAWAAYTMSEVGRVLPECYLYPKFLDIVGSLNEQLASIKLLQTENGLWRTILDDKDSYEEISASCGIAAAMINKGNPLHIKYLNKATKGILENISEDGRVLNVSGGTAVMKDRDGYRNISRDWIQGWGQGLALAYLAGLLDYDNNRSDGAL